MVRVSTRVVTVIEKDEILLDILNIILNFKSDKKIMLCIETKNSKDSLGAVHILSLSVSSWTMRDDVWTNDPEVVQNP